MSSSLGSAGTCKCLWPSRHKACFNPNHKVGLACSSDRMGKQPKCARCRGNGSAREDEEVKAEKDRQRNAWLAQHGNDPSASSSVASGKRARKKPRTESLQSPAAHMALKPAHMALKPEVSSEVYRLVSSLVQSMEVKYLTDPDEDGAPEGRRFFQHPLSEAIVPFALVVGDDQVRLCASSRVLELNQLCVASSLPAVVDGGFEVIAGEILQLSFEASSVPPVWMSGLSKEENRELTDLLVGLYMEVLALADSMQEDGPDGKMSLMVHLGSLRGDHVDQLCYVGQPWRWHDGKSVLALFGEGTPTELPVEVEGQAQVDWAQKFHRIVVEDGGLVCAQTVTSVEPLVGMQQGQFAVLPANVVHRGPQVDEVWLKSDHVYAVVSVGLGVGAARTLLPMLLEYPDHVCAAARAMVLQLLTMGGVKLVNIVLKARNPYNRGTPTEANGYVAFEIARAAFAGFLKDHIVSRRNDGVALRGALFAKITVEHFP
jgi:hypothetical protein